MKSHLAFIVLSVVAIVLSPSASAQDSTASVVAGSTLTLNASADGTAPITFRWIRNGIEIGQGNKLTLPTITTNDAGDYVVVASNAFGSTPSDKLTLTVTAAGVPPSKPVITKQLVSITAPKQSTATFWVSATGEQLQYRWFKNNTPLLGATSTLYTIPKVNPSNAGTYTVLVSNPAGSEPSTATLWVR